jgi:hypothetical protein
VKDIQIKKKKVKSSSEDNNNGATKYKLNSSKDLSQKYMNANDEK